MKKLFVVIAVSGTALIASLGLVACGGGDDTSGGGNGGEQGRILKGTYASFPDYLDPQLSYTAEGWTAMGEVYIPLLTYKHAEGEEGQRGRPRPGRRPAENQQRRQDLHPETAARPQILRRHPGQSLRLHPRGRTRLHPQLRRLALLHRHRRRGRVRRNEERRHPRHRSRRPDRRSRHQPDEAARNLRERAGADVRRSGSRRHADGRPIGRRRRPAPAPTRSRNRSPAKAGNTSATPTGRKPTRKRCPNSRPAASTGPRSR